jgi:hypothetical protein
MYKRLAPCRAFFFAIYKIAGWKASRLFGSSRSLLHYWLALYSGGRRNKADFSFIRLNTSGLIRRPDTFVAVGLPFV